MVFFVGASFKSSDLVWLLCCNYILPNYPVKSTFNFSTFKSTPRCHAVMPFIFTLRTLSVLANKDVYNRNTVLTAVGIFGR